jgi:hypothetical protein
MKVNSSQALLIVIALGFTSFALLDWFWIIPYGIWERSLAERFFVSSIFTVLTIILLNWLFIVREEHEWKTVKEKVYRDIQFELDCLFYEILQYIENGSMVQMRLVSENSETKSKTILSELERIKDREELELNAMQLKLLFEDKSSLDAFSTAARNLDSVEIKYWRFLPSELISCLIDFRLAIKSLELLIQSHISLEKIPILTKTAEFQEWERNYPKLIKFSFKKMIEEMYKIWKTCAENL